MQKPPLIVYWSRRDFRVSDNPALSAAIAASNTSGVPLLPLFILEDYMVEGNPKFQFGYPSRFFLSLALPQFAKQFPEFAIVRGKGARYVIELAARYQLSVFANDDVYADFYSQVQKIRDAGVTITVCEGALSVPKETRSQEGKLYSAFTPFKKNVWSHFVEQTPLPEVSFSNVEFAHVVMATLPCMVAVDTNALLALFSTQRTILIRDRVIDLGDYTVLPKLVLPYVSEMSAKKYFQEYLTSGNLDAYAQNRDSLELDTIEKGKTSKMSLALAWGLVSSRQLLSMMQAHFGESFDNPFSNRVSQGALTYISELIWREFYRYQLFHHPELMNTEFQERFRGTIAWVDDAVAYERFIAWIKGETGYPIVDAAMRQIAQTGWMHNRSRMVVASILTKNLGVDWRWGQEYFRAALLDLDEASNNGGWQWGASVGADPKPIRIFNPELQAKNYDASGAYQARWLRSDSILQSERMLIVPHKEAREAALKRYGLEKEEPRDY